MTNRKMIDNVILLIGRNPGVLAGLAAALVNEGYLVRTTDLVEQASSQFNAAEINLIAFGRGVDAVTNARLRADFLSQNPEVLFVDGLAPVIPLLVRQIKQALSGNQTVERTLIKFTCQPTRQLEVDVTVTEACRLTIEVYELDAVHTSHQQTLVSTYVSAGTHTFKIDGQYAVSSTISFLVAGVDNGELLVLPIGPNKPLQL
ncbi:hypothetical protein [Spirosoma utsteinense]|uniref:Uncharacterized protein n=1 Tax=Spirosoma utsteinense TaxID=2585773 RepID=A0ABR6W161_9BACT|nr:hypothetical protein [Spirosoma utsteinense]MBC3785110.1 hypothetical protein [Spirosoma utsteinense]MBC3790280.1 hypothetical protein [Spirosoma utsteinense]